MLREEARDFYQYWGTERDREMLRVRERGIEIYIYSGRGRERELYTDRLER